MAKIIYTHTDEAPALAAKSLLPIVKAFIGKANVEIETADISLAGRIIANFPEFLSPEQQINDTLSELGEIAKTPDANIIKLPNVSASIPQLTAAVKELQAHGYDLPDYPEEPKDDKERSIKARYDKIKGSAVNPVLREGNSDRRAPEAVKNFARKFPHSMGKWRADSKSHVASMKEGDFYGSEKSTTIESTDEVSIEFTGNDGSTKTLKDSFPLQKGEVIDTAVMSLAKLKSFIENEIADAKAQGILFSLHLKATMMKVSDPIIFGAVVEVYYKDIFERYAATFETIGVDAANGIGEVYRKIQTLDPLKQKEIENAIKKIHEVRPALAMVDSEKGITNLHVPSDVIIDASMPAMIRASGQMWNKHNRLQDTKAVIPDRCYSGVYQVIIEDCRANGAYDPATMGSVPNVGLMAQKAEEYGSHDKTFQADKAGKVQVVDGRGVILLEQDVSEGDIFRMCRVKDAPIQNWVKLAVNRAEATKAPAVFWLDKKRAHDAALIAKVAQYLKDHDTSGIEIHILPPVEAARFSVERMRKGLDTISVTGNVLRDYLTDLFPILEVGTSAKMLSIVPLMSGGSLFETGAGGSAPKHVQQFYKEGHLRWDSLGEFLALAVSLRHLADKYHSEPAKLMAKTLDNATTEFLEENKSPSRKVNEIDNRGSHFYLAMYWAGMLAKQDTDLGIKKIFERVHHELVVNEAKINEELLAVQGNPVDIGGYYQPDIIQASEAMRPSKTLNAIIETLS